MSTRVKKNTAGYGYKYADLAEIQKYIESIGRTYYQYINVLDDGREQIMTKRDDIEQPIPGCIVAEAVLSGTKNPAQEHGSALTYARRYSLLMAFGLATDDDDAESLNESRENKGIRREITNYCNKKKLSLITLAKEFHLKGMTDDELTEVFKEIKDKYGI